MAEESRALTPDDWLSPLSAVERLEMTLTGLCVHYEVLRADVDQLVARVAEIERARARDEEL